MQTDTCTQLQKSMNHLTYYCIVMSVTLASATKCNVKITLNCKNKNAFFMAHTHTKKKNEKYVANFQSRISLSLLSLVIHELAFVIYEGRH